MLRTRDVVISARYLSEQERVVIADLHRAGVSGRSPPSSDAAHRGSAGSWPATPTPVAATMAGVRQSRVVCDAPAVARRVWRDTVLRGFVQQYLDVR